MEFKATILVVKMKVLYVVAKFVVKKSEYSQINLMPVKTKPKQMEPEPNNIVVIEISLESGSGSEPFLGGLT